MKQYHINEIFYSLQGEGYHTGHAAVFIRFSGCNLRCRFCDTHHTTFTPMTLEEILQQVARYPNEAIIVLTGGEPSLSIDQAFIDALHQCNNVQRYITIETNGTRLLPTGIDWITLSPKIGIDGGCDSITDLAVRQCDELKVVNCYQDLTMYDTIVAKHHYLQPCDTENAHERTTNLLDCIEKVKRWPQWKLSLQTHKLINIP
ncbi:MAG: radical SAM protein [Bacteroidales bacterium]|nr:radical SAM protein [Bacteroidales bacterium]